MLSGQDRRMALSPGDWGKWTFLAWSFWQMLFGRDFVNQVCEVAQTADHLIHEDVNPCHQKRLAVRFIGTLLQVTEKVIQIVEDQFSVIDSFKGGFNQGRVSSSASAIASRRSRIRCSPMQFPQQPHSSI